MRVPFLNRSQPEVDPDVVGQIEELLSSPAALALLDDREAPKIARRQELLDLIKAANDAWMRDRPRLVAEEQAAHRRLETARAAVIAAQDALGTATGRTSQARAARDLAVSTAERELRMTADPQLEAFTHDLGRLRDETLSQGILERSWKSPDDAWRWPSRGEDDYAVNEPAIKRRLDAIQAAQREVEALATAPLGRAAIAARIAELRGSIPSADSMRELTWFSDGEPAGTGA